MRRDWIDYLARQGAVAEHGVVRHFGDPAGELAASAHGAICADLSHLGLLLYGGADAGAFLHGQFSSDVKSLRLEQSQYASYNTAKGRMLASLLVWRMEAGYALQLPADLAAPIVARLTRYILRSKVHGSDARDAWTRFGIAGIEAAALLRQLFGAVPEHDHQVRQLPAGALLRLPGERYQLVLPRAEAQFYWEQLSAHLTPVGADCWDWLEIRAGIPSITTATSELFSPQMANMELIGAVSFNKGCYPGQEIVARTQYLGQVKRRLFLLHADTSRRPLPGQPLFGAGPDRRESGIVVNAQLAPGGGYDLLAVLQTDAVQAGALHLDRYRGAPLALLPLPYPT